MVTFENINKSYNGIEAVRDINFEVDKGELFGLIGPDGAGKTTIFQMLTTVLLPDSGTITFDGKNVVDEYKYVRKSVGYMPGKFALYQDLSVTENLEFFATIFGTTIEANYEIIKDIYQQLEPFGHRRAGALSGGMKQKLALSCALIHKPLVLVLDEPTFGVDAVSRAEFWDMLKSLKQRGVTILVSTPYMDEALLCDRVALIQKGTILKIDTPQNIEEQFERNLYKVRTEKVYPVLQFLRNDLGLEHSYTFGQEIHIYSDEVLDLDEVRAKIEASCHVDFTVEEGKANIEDCFMDMMVRSGLTEKVEG
jgi:ABC-type multidrug transport system ATPase subunit